MKEPKQTTDYRIPNCRPTQIQLYVHVSTNKRSWFGRYTVFVETLIQRTGNYKLLWALVKRTTLLRSLYVWDRLQSPGFHLQPQHHCSRWTQTIGKVVLVLLVRLFIKVPEGQCISLPKTSHWFVDKIKRGVGCVLVDLDLCILPYPAAQLCV